MKIFGPQCPIGVWSDVNECVVRCHPEVGPQSTCCAIKPCLKGATLKTPGDRDPAPLDDRAIREGGAQYLKSLQR